MPSYKLTYFNARGSVEASRIIMAYADIKYEDIRLEFNGPAWLELKPKTPFGALPTLEVDGEVLCQSKTISRYLAKLAGLMGSSDWEDAKIDMVVDCTADLLKPLFSHIFEKDEDRKKELGEKFKESLPAEVKKMEKLIPLGSNHFVGNKMTWADIETSYVLTIPALVGFTINWNEVPRLKTVVDTVESNPKIAEWIANRPKTDH